ncbi:tRNA lysidine(34) synthetase TilS [Oceanobacillus damuensis]|uniref:tRNA lysidine(34) synthetase TilS n=1 Tax=Oceanobacillus damuensis TaxID=937928 RepID=UPI00082BBE2F|nr:tRNA lysidine(34) synthetase TilS [Oceanobacillus damuensis]
MKQEVLTFIKKHQLLRKNATVLVGVSGGPDSMALLHFLLSLEHEWNLNIVAVSVDHQLRGEESLEDLRYVERICNEWGAEFVGASLDVASYRKKHGIGTELAGRELRYRFFEQQMELYQADFLALGHHGDDQVETMLMKMSRTASSSFFNGIPVHREFSTGYIIRPFLCITKEILENYCKENHIEARIDATNFETEYTRNFYRHKVMPLIKEKNSNIHMTVQHLSETLSEDEEFLRKEAEKMVDELVDFQGENGMVTFHAELFKNRAQALQRRAYHLILNYLYDVLPKDLSYGHEEQFFALLQRKEGNAQLDFPSALKLENSYGRMTFYFAEHHEDPNLSYHYTLDIPGKLKLPDGSTITANFAEKNTEQNTLSYIFSSEQVKLPLHIRTRKPGDRMSWKGLNGSKKLKDIFIDAKIPLSARESWPVITDDEGKIIWLIGLKKGQPTSGLVRGATIHLLYEKGKN